MQVEECLTKKFFRKIKKTLMEKEKGSSQSLKKMTKKIRTGRRGTDFKKSNRRKRIRERELKKCEIDEKWR